LFAHFFNKLVDGYLFIEVATIELPWCHSLVRTVHFSA